MIEYDGGQITVTNHYGAGIANAIRCLRFNGGSFAGYSSGRVFTTSAQSTVQPTPARSEWAQASSIAGEKDAANTVTGAAASDLLFGGDFDDLMTGNGGRDLLFGGAGADTYKYMTINDSGVTAATSDVIADS